MKTAPPATRRRMLTNKSIEKRSMRILELFKGPYVLNLNNIKICIIFIYEIKKEYDHIVSKILTIWKNDRKANLSF